MHYSIGESKSVNKPMSPEFQILKNQGFILLFIKENMMRVSYDKLWSLMKENHMRKKDVAAAAEISSSTMTKLNKEKAVSMDTMLKFCKIFHCDIGDVMQVIED